MRSIGGHYEDISPLHLVGLTSNINLDEPLDNLNESVEWYSMLAQPLTLVEGEDCHSPSSLVDYRPADD